jgi:hypothetical protein
VQVVLIILPSPLYIFPDRSSSTDRILPEHTASPSKWRPWGCSRLGWYSVCQLHPIVRKATSACPTNYISTPFIHSWHTNEYSSCSPKMSTLSGGKIIWKGTVIAIDAIQAKQIAPHLKSNEVMNFLYIEIKDGTEYYGNPRSFCRSRRKFKAEF